MGIERGVGEAIHLWKVHGDENLPALDGGSDVNGGPHFAAARADENVVVFAEAESGGIARVDLDLGG